MYFQKFLLPKKLREFRSNRCDIEHLRRAVAKGNAQSRRKKEGKHEHPEKGFRFAHELAKPYQSQLHQRVVSERSPVGRLSGVLGSANIADGNITHRVNGVPSKLRRRPPMLRNGFAAPSA